MPGLAADRPLRVLFIIDDLYTGGAERGLVEEVLAFETGRVRPQIVVLQGGESSELTSEVRIGGIPVQNMWSSGLLDPWRFIRLVWLIRRLRPDIVQTSLDYANMLGVLTARLAGIPVVSSLRSTITQQSRGGTLKRALHNLIIRWGSARVMMVANSAVDEAARECNLPVDRVVAMPNAIDLDRVEPARLANRATVRQAIKVPSDVPLACVVARLDEVKGHRYLLDAIPLMKLRDTPLHFVLVGIGSYGDDTVERNIRSQAAALGLSERIHLVGERTDVLEIMASSDLFVLPSLKEGLSRALLEAMALSLPVIATDAGGHRDVLGTNATGWCIPTEDPVSLARAIDEALDDPTEARQRGKRAHALITDRFSIRAHVERLEALYREVVEAR